MIIMIYQKDLNDIIRNSFLRYDSGFNDEERFVVFFSNYKENITNKIKTLIIDGTFRSAPPHWTQLLVVHGWCFNKSFSICYILMKSRTEDCYFKVFKQLKDLLNLEPTLIITDMEKALLNGLVKNFRHCRSELCLFHFGQAIWRRLNELGLSNKYKNDIEFKEAIKMIIYLAFVPVEDVVKIYIMIKSMQVYKGDYKIQELVKYFERNFIGKWNGAILVSSEARYNINSWNVYRRVIDCQPRTSNNAES